MRSLVSMFWPSPVVDENYRQLLGKTDFIAWFKNSIIVSVSSTLLVATAIGTIGGVRPGAPAILGFGPSWRARC